MDLNIAMKDNWQEANEAQSYNLADAVVGILRNAVETPDTLCMLVSKLPNGVADRWNRNTLMLQRSQQREPSFKDFIEFFDEQTVLVKYLSSREKL